MSTRSLKKFFIRIVRDTRGEDLTEKSSGLSNAGKVVMAAVAISVAAAGATTLVNNGSSAGDHTSQQINGAVGAQTQTTQQATAPFQVK